MARDMRAHGEFSGGEGLINDEERRTARVVGQEATATGYSNLNEELMEIYATNPADVAADPSTSDLTFKSTGR